MTLKHSEFTALIERAIEIDEAFKAVKPLYREREAIMTELLKHNVPTMIEIMGYIVILKDNFTDKNTVWKASSVSRYELEIVRKDTGVVPEEKKRFIDPFRVKEKRD